MKAIPPSGHGEEYFGRGRNSFALRGARQRPKLVKFMKSFPMFVVEFIRCAALVLLLALPWKNQAVAAESPVDCANPLVGTAPLDDPQFIGNAPPPGEEIYTGFTLP